MAKNEKVDEFDSFLDRELANIEQQRKARMDSKDYKPWTHIEVGENNFDFIRTPPRPNAKYSNRMVFRVMVENPETGDMEERDLAISKEGPLFSDIIKFMKSGKTKAKIVRTGKNRDDTRYTLMERK